MRAAACVMRGGGQVIAAINADLRIRDDVIDRLATGIARMQAARPITVGDRVDAWRAPLAVDLEALSRMSKRGQV